MTLNRRELATYLACQLKLIYPEIDSEDSLEGTLNNVLMDFEEQLRETDDDYNTEEGDD